MFKLETNNKLLLLFTQPNYFCIIYDNKYEENNTLDNIIFILITFVIMLYFTSLTFIDRRHDESYHRIVGIQ